MVEVKRWLFVFPLQTPLPCKTMRKSVFCLDVTSPHFFGAVPQLHAHAQRWRMRNMASRGMKLAYTRYRHVFSLQTSTVLNPRRKMCRTLNVKAPAGIFLMRFGNSRVQFGEPPHVYLRLLLVEVGTNCCLHGVVPTVI